MCYLYYISVSELISYLVESTLLWWCNSEICLNNKLKLFTSQSIFVPIKGDTGITLKLIYASHIILGPVEYREALYMYYCNIDKMS